VVAALLDGVDETYSRFRPDSELSRLNAAAGRAVPVGPLLFSAIDAALRAARLSEGAVDPTIGQALRLAGYDADFARIVVDGGEVILTMRAVPGWQAIRLDRASRTVTLPQGVELDLGSTGKALAADLAAAAAHDEVGGGVLVSLGGDIATAGQAPPGGWRILVAEDSEAPPDGDGEAVCIHAAGMATSSTTVRRWTRGGVTLHHIIDPRTGLPARSPWRTVTVAAATCVDANIAATAAIVRGQGAITWLGDIAMPARLVANSGAVHRVSGWPAALQLAS
jgi:thiamine biosynthesis lipoprotein